MRAIVNRIAMYRVAHTQVIPVCAEHDRFVSQLRIATIHFADHIASLDLTNLRGSADVETQRQDLRAEA